MPDPNDRPSRRKNPAYWPSSSNEHPFLTPKGYQLQREGRIGDIATPRSLPHYSAPGEVFFDDPFADDPEVDPNLGDTDLGGPRDSMSVVKPFPNYESLTTPLHNVLPSKKFPDVAKLGRVSLRPYFKSKPVGDITNNQLRAIGKLFIYTPVSPWGEPASGSAFIAGPSMLITSAHNLYDVTHRNWSRSLVFHPGYDYYSTVEKPTCRVTSCHIPRGYFDNPTTNNDIAICYVDCNIGDMVDAVIPTKVIDSSDFFNQTRVAIVGYPATSGFDFGKQMWQCQGDYLFSRSSGGDDDYSPVIATDFGGGASGCPWVMWDKIEERYVAVGVTSGHSKLSYVSGEPNLMATVSPYFGVRTFDRLANDHVTHEFA